MVEKKLIWTQVTVFELKWTELFVANKLIRKKEERYLLKRNEIVRFSYDPSHSNYLELSMDNYTKDYAKSSLY
jgi:hypothetical protein